MKLERKPAESICCSSSWRKCTRVGSTTVLDTNSNCTYKEDKLLTKTNRDNLVLVSVAMLYSWQFYHCTPNEYIPFEKRTIHRGTKWKEQVARVHCNFRNTMIITSNGNTEQNARRKMATNQNIVTTAPWQLQYRDNASCHVPPGRHVAWLNPYQQSVLVFVPRLYSCM